MARGSQVRGRVSEIRRRSPFGASSEGCGRCGRRRGGTGERAFQVTDPNGVIVQLLDWNAPAGQCLSGPGRRTACRPGRKPGHERAPRARRPAIPHRTRRHVVTERTTRRRPGLKHIRRPRTLRGWLITIAAGGAILALKLTLGLGVLALVVHLLTH